MPAPLSVGDGASAAALLGLTTDVLQVLERLALPSRRPVLGASAGQRRSLRHGSSLDLADFRPYTPGDDIRRLDWSAYARLGRLFMRLYAGEEDTCVTLWVDCSASMACEPVTKERPGRAIAGAIAYLALAAWDRAACVGFGTSVVGRAGPVRGKRSAPRLWAALAGLPRSTGTEWKSVTGAASQWPRGMAVVISDFLSRPDELRPALAALRRAGNEVLLVQVLSPGELRPAVKGELRLVDSETGRAVEVTMGRAALAAYQHARAEHGRELAALARGYRARLVVVDGSTSLRQVLLGQMVRTGVLI
ncbi:MAG TPA: DUF58 domain-containing protein [Acidimicrobiales bacterium]|nr:DUF58 domain-containing protein [Acidimicrobiales bacterium]